MSVGSPHYRTPRAFSRLAKSVVRALLEYHAARTASSLPRIPEGQYLVLHRVGDHYVPLFVHVKRSYSGHEVIVHPAPLDNRLDPVSRARGIHVPYGTTLLRILESALRGEKIVPRSSAELAVVSRLGTRRSTIQYPPLPEYADGYIANHLLQELDPDSGVYALRMGNVFVLDYHVRNGSVDARLRPYDPKIHSPVRLKTVWFEEHCPLHIIKPEQYTALRVEADRQRHLRPRISESKNP